MIGYLNNGVPKITLDILSQRVYDVCMSKNTMNMEKENTTENKTAGSCPAAWRILNEKK